jgi:hypothetical protein
MPTTKKNPNRGANARNNQGSKWISKRDRLALYLRDRFTCQYCGRDLHGAAPAEVTLDHLDPRCSTLCPKERRNPRRLVTACRSCNSARQDTPWIEYATGGAIDRINRTVRRSMDKYRKLAAAIMAGEAGDPRLENR